jgi:hypothetical protein
MTDGRINDNAINWGIHAKPLSSNPHDCEQEFALVAAQTPEGSWLPRNGNEKSAGAVYATSLALLSLSVYHHFLPIYQK